MKNLLDSFSALPIPRQAESLCVWGASLLGILLLFQLLILPVQLLLLVLVAAVLLIAGVGWHKKGLRLLARVLCLLMPVAVMGLFAVDAVLSAGTGAEANTVLLYVCVFFAPVLCYHLPAFATLANKEGRYDVWAYRVLYTLYVAVVALCGFGSFTDAIVWLWEAEAIRFAWLAVAVVGYVCSWVNHRKERPAAPEKKEKAAETSSAAE